MLNRIQTRFSKQEIEDFIECHMEEEIMDAAKVSISSEEDFENLILAYDYSTRKNSKYKVLEEDVDSGPFYNFGNKTLQRKVVNVIINKILFIRKKSR